MSKTVEERLLAAILRPGVNIAAQSALIGAQAAQAQAVKALCDAAMTVQGDARPQATALLRLRALQLLGAIEAVDDVVRNAGATVVTHIPPAPTLTVVPEPSNAA